MRITEMMEWNRHRKKKKKKKKKKKEEEEEEEEEERRRRRSWKTRQCTHTTTPDEWQTTESRKSAPNNRTRMNEKKTRKEHLLQS